MPTANLIPEIPLRRSLCKDAIFYIYVYYDVDGIARYVGKGKGDRINHHNKASAKGRLASAIREGVIQISEKIEEGLTEVIAFSSERYWISHFGREIDGGTLWNKTCGGQGVSGLIMPRDKVDQLASINRGRKHTPEARERIAAANRGVKRSEDMRKKMSERQRNRSASHLENLSASMKGKIASQETREKQSAAKRGRIIPSDVRAKMSASHKTPDAILRTKYIHTGRKHTEEAIAKISASARNISDETRAKMAAASSGRKQSREAIERSASARRGAKRSPETIERMKAAKHLNLQKALINA